ncbi:hypothetical protein B5807_11476 [Epicoccum nigrum]|uniref:Cytochrome P450 n=1 Tax=Epicoccum nigrum TaxID=105696 RepID=A0A1Y2LJM8_EPING|nr:hypothetical protein B5807_11476 [Epicoccum nigrum]
MIRQLLAMPEEFITREITKDSSGFSPTWLLRRIVGPSLPNYTGPHLSTYRAGFIREFNSTESLAKDFDAIKTLAQTHVNGLIDEQANSATVNIISHIDIFAISLWRTILYGSSDSETDSRALSLAKEIGARVTDPWPSLWYSINVILGFVDAGEPLGSDKVLRDQLDDLITDSVQNLEDYERLNPQAPPTSLRGLSARTHGSVLEGLSQTAIEFARLNAFTGNETFGYNLAWLVIELDKWPECLQKLLAEIGCSDTADFKTVNSNIPYLDAVITEVNRLHPPIASTFRTVNREINVISRKSHYKLQLGTIVFLALGCANRSVKDWGKDADLFVPERWLGKTEGIPPHLAFGYGSRSCVGYRTALLGTKMYLVELLRRYHVVLKKHDYRVSPGEILGVESPLTIEFLKARTSLASSF